MKIYLIETFSHIRKQQYSCPVVLCIYCCMTLMFEFDVMNEWRGDVQRRKGDRKLLSPCLHSDNLLSFWWLFIPAFIRKLSTISLIYSLLTPALYPFLKWVWQRSLTLVLTWINNTKCRPFCLNIDSWVLIVLWVKHYSSWSSRAVCVLINQLPSKLHPSKFLNHQKLLQWLFLHLELSCRNYIYSPLFLWF